jgi:SOS-response transcriptional repressor LexA
MTKSVKKSKITETLKAISFLQARFGVSPTLREIQAELGLRSSNPVSFRLRRLEKIGLIARSKKARSIVITNAGLKLLSEYYSGFRFELGSLANPELEWSGLRFETSGTSQQ